MNSGVREIEIHDSVTGAAFPAVVQYPTTQPVTTTTIGPYDFNAARDATLAAGRFPLCVISHGGGGSHLLYRSIGTSLASAGYIVVCPEHAGDNRRDRSLSNTDAAARGRPRHATLAIDAVLADAQLGPATDASRVVIVGHSMGGYTALALVGAQPWSRNRQPIRVNADPRVKAAVLLAPATDWFLGPASLANVTTPLLVMVGDRDTVTPLDSIRHALLGLPAHTSMTLDVVSGAHHYAFLTPFPAHLRRPDFPPSLDPDGFDRETFHIALQKRILHYLNNALVLPSSD